VKTPTNDNNISMSLTSSQWSAAEILPQPLQPHMAKYINKLALTIFKLGGGYTENNIWDAYKKL
jgi:hypothetical protein